ncbi:glycosyltransferase [Atlantibacter sp.]|uniref:glycosyltransferase n=1 Tax=Atlantibacter sp. TaxID=1903473 RepID=UPI0028977EF1|nr:glycosyltransferase [Atlantibacter sp.]
MNVSITIPVYHAEKTLPSLVASRLKENRINVELNSVNNRSTGQTISVINRIRDDRIILVELANKGVYAARNMALTMHRGD